MERPTLRLRWVETEDEDTQPVATRLKTPKFAYAGEKLFWSYKLQQAWVDDGKIIWKDVPVGIETEDIECESDSRKYSINGDEV